jgi:hypothetical protein
MMQSVFVLLVAAGTVFFLWRRTIDPLSLAFGASVVYFLPGLFGFAGIGDYQREIEPGTYVVLLNVLTAVIAATFIFDSARFARRPKYSLPFDDVMPPVFAAIMLVAASMSLSTTGPYYFCLDKTVMLSHINAWYYWAAYATPFCLAAAFVTRQRWLLVTCVLLVLFDVFIGFRATAAIAFFTLVMLTGHHFFGGFRKAATYGMLVLAVGGSFFLLKQVQYTLKYSVASLCDAALARSGAAPMTSRNPASKQWASLASYLGTSAAYREAGALSEPFVTQSILNEVVRTGFQTEPGYVLRQIATGIPGAATIFGLNLGVVPTFNSQFQPALFPDVRFGMADNPWAQMYAVGGRSLVLFLALIYAGSAALLSWAFHRTEGVLKASVTVLSGWLLFYLHRNDLLIEIGILKQVAYVFCAALLASACIAASIRTFGARWKHAES